MLRLARTLGFSASPAREGVVEVSLPLA